MDAASVSAVSKQPAIYHHTPDHVFLGSFNWLDDNDDIDLRLTLDDYRADLKPKPVTTARGPPSLFRRRLSVNKMSFGRSSISSTRPGTMNSSVDQVPPMPIHLRRKSRALSLISPKHGQKPPTLSIDSDAVDNYPDPDARHRLYAHFASPPQKLNGAQANHSFFANEGHSSALSRAPQRRSRSFSQGLYMASSEKLKTFLADDQSSVHSEETSIPDSESPRTPHTPHTFDTQYSNTKPFALPSHSDVPADYGHVLGASRDMTLRMTLTRPDLRSRDEEPYGWPGAPAHAPQQPRPISRPFLVDSPVPDSPIAITTSSTKENMDQIFADIDKELSSSTDGGFKRFWKRVRRN
ncbi:hypothetical protein F4808DRAFT_456420 [Astrocystis sublimbata]|nr:hypothetical protein F4808DRAFT_456420 [Astrocystis sublimbata]